MGRRPPPRGRQIKTRSRYPHGFVGTDESEKSLGDTLRNLGLYAAHTTGDGNCLFRALADQLYGDPKLHVQVRADICDFLEAHAAYFQNYVLDCEDDDLAANFASHVLEMRRQGTYGDDMELTAFTKMTGREIRVVQPGLVYVVADHSPLAAPAAPTPSSSSAGSTSAEPIDIDDEPHAAAIDAAAPLSHREKRRLAREAKGKSREVDTPSPLPSATPASHALWIVYHSYEHYSSARNLAGPHAGLPLTEPRAADAHSDSTPPLTEDSDDASSDSTPSPDERLLLQSLPSDSPHATLPAARALIAKHGTGEQALEAALAEYNDPESEPEPDDAHDERKRSASPTLPEGSSPRQRLREDGDFSDESSDDSAGDDAPPDPHGHRRRAATPVEGAGAHRRPLKDRERRGSDRLLAPMARETRAQARERLAKQQAARATRSARSTPTSDVCAEGIRMLRV